jgi:hypothetical protein
MTMPSRRSRRGISGSDPGRPFPSAQLSVSRIQWIASAMIAAINPKTANQDVAAISSSALPFIETRLQWIDAAV